MGLFDNKEAWRELIAKAELNRPSVGKRVVISQGNHEGKQGIVTRHGIDRFDPMKRYRTDAQLHMNDINGRYGYYCTVKTDSGERINLKAFMVDVIVEAAAHAEYCATVDAAIKKAKGE